MKAMILLGINCGFGNADCGALEHRHLDLKSGWADYPRPKTGVHRRCKLWSETIKAIKAIVGQRTPADPRHGSLVFLTKDGLRWKNDRPCSSMAHEFRKLMDAAGVVRHRVGFYALRHTFATVGSESLDQITVDHIMGHAKDDMPSVYRERISDERRERVATFVHDWLFPKKK